MKHEKTSKVTASLWVDGKRVFKKAQPMTRNGLGKKTITVKKRGA